MMHWNKTTALLTGLAIIVLGNTVALIGIYYNRSGEPDAEVTLSQRELQLPNYYGFESENSGIALRLQWRVDDDNSSSYYYWGHPAWLNETKLHELGFDTSTPVNTPRAAVKYQQMLPREAYVVLEFMGATYEARLQHAREELARQQRLAAEHPSDKQHRIRLQQAKDALKNEENRDSRLFAVDAGTDKTSLRHKYPNRHRYIIAAAQIRIMAYNKQPKDPLYLTGTIRKLSIGSITAPFAVRKVLDPYMNRKAYQKRQKLKYQVTVAFGRRLEPWIKGLRIIQSN